MKKRISVALATYNGEKYIEAQLLSIFKQSMPVDEIIVYDDCSKDHTLDIIKRYTLQDELNVKVFKSDTNVGYIKNFAKALKMTSGDIIFLCDQDDVWEQNKVQKILQVFNEQPHTICVNTSFTYMNEVENSIHKEHQGNNYGMCWQKTQQGYYHQITIEEIMFHNISMGCTMAFTSKLRDIYLSKSTYLAPHDWELNFIAATQQGLFFLNEPLMKYRIHEHNTTGNDKLNKQNSVYASEREKNAATLLCYVKNLFPYINNLSKEEQKQLAQLQLFHEKRLSLLRDKRTRCWFSLFCKQRFYGKVVSKKGQLTDFLYSLHK